MPKVETYQADQVETQISSGPRARAPAAGSFGEPIAQGLSNLAGSLQTRKNQLDTTAAEEASVGFERDKNSLFFNPDNGYFNTQGKDAFEQADGMNESLEKLKRTYSEGLTSPEARQAFDRVATQQITRSQSDIARHSSKNLKAWEISTINSQVENTLENASLYHGDSERLGVQHALGRQSILDASEMEGLSPESTQERLETYDSSFATSTVTAATNSSSAEGQTSLDRWEKSLEGPDLIKVKNQIKKKKISEKTQQDSGEAVLKSTNLVSTFGDENNARSLILDEVNKIKDPELRSLTAKESMHQLNRKQTADSEESAANFEDAEGFIVDGGSVSAYRASNPEDWEKMSSKQKRVLNSGSTVVTDYVYLSGTLLLPKEKLAEVNPSDHFDKLSKPDRAKLITAVKAARAGKVDNQVGRSRITQTTGAVVELFGAKRDWSKTDIKRANAFYSVMDDEVQFREEQKGSPLTSTEYTETLAALTKKVVKKDDFLYFDSEKDLTEIPADDLQAVSDFLHTNNIPATSENIIKAWEQASK